MHKLSIFLAVVTLASAERPKTPAPASVAVNLETLARVVKMGSYDVIPLYARQRFTTVIELPEGEEIMRVICGDSGPKGEGNWQVDRFANLAFIKPAIENSRTSLNLLTTTGRTYSFTIEESSMHATDLKVKVESKEESLLSAGSMAVKYVPVEQVNDYRAMAQLAQQKLEKSELAVAEQIAAMGKKMAEESARVEAAVPARMKFYDWSPSKIFAVESIWNDGRFTYIKATPQEVPALYEIKDDKPNLVDFQFAPGLYTVPKVIERGYLTIGKKRFDFVVKP
jgi:type IV secretory pathway VirB9-like protein